MEVLLILTYSAICICIFKVFKLPLNKWTVPTAVLGGIILLGAIMVTMNYNHPYSEVARKYVPTTPIVPEVSGHVVDVPIKANHPLEPGEILFQIDAAPFVAKRDALRAQLSAAEEDLDRAQTLRKRGVGSERDVDRARSEMERLEGELEVASFHVEETTVRAPGHGYVTQLILHPGMRAVSLPLQPSMVFVHDQDARYVAFFWQNNVLRIEPGLEAEIAFDAIPGKVFTGKVEEVLPMMAEGQLKPSGTLITVNPYAETAGRVPVIISISDPRFEAYQLPGGAFGQAAVYSEHAHHVAIIRRMLLRMSSWMSFLFPFH